MKINLKNIKRYILIGASLTLVGFGIEKTYDFHNSRIKYHHEHVYKDSEGYCIRVLSEKEKIGDYIKQQEYRLINEPSDNDMEMNLFNSGFVKIADNLELLGDLEEKLSGERTYKGNGQVELVGEYAFFGYRVIKVENGNYIFEESPYVKSLEEIMEEYPYIRKSHFFRIVNSNEIVTDFSKSL